MTEQEFDELVESRLNKIKETLLVKAKEYRRNEDPLWNFNQAAKSEGITPTRALHGFMLKHWISYKDMLDDIDKGEYSSEDYVDEKLGDIIVYMILQEANIKAINNFINDSKRSTSNKCKNDG